KPTGIAVAQQHVGGVAAKEIAEASKHPIRTDHPLESGEQRVVSDVIDFVLAVSAMPQDDVGSSARGRRRVRRDCEEEAAKISVVVVVKPDDLARVVDAAWSGASTSRAQGIVDGGVGAVAVEEAVVAAVVKPDDLAHIVDAMCLAADGGQGIIDGGVGAVAVEEAVTATGGVVPPDDLAIVVDVLCMGAADLQGIVEAGPSFAA